MPDIQNSAERDFSAYDLMSDEDLENLLRNDFSKPMGEESDIEMLLYITEVLAQRRKDRKEGNSPAEAWESFKQNYYTENDNSYISEIVPVSKKRYSGRWKWGLIATAAVLALVVGTSVTANAFKFDIWGPVANWTKDAFYFSNESQATVPAESNNKYSELQEALAEYGVLPTMVPSWLPEGYEAVDVTTTEMPTKRYFVAHYQNNEKSIRIKISYYLNSDPSQIEQSETWIETYRSNGIDYYIFNNYDQLRASWINNNCECVITGPLSISEIKEMIDSIGKG